MKKFRLPKEFAEKWLTALRSGEYLQGQGYLAELNDPDISEDNALVSSCTFCCIGVGAYISERNLTGLLGLEIVTDKYEGFPEELTGTAVDNLFVKALVSLNDGILLSQLLENCEQNSLIIDTEALKEKHSTYQNVRFSFSEIADFIENNTEFY